MTIQNLLVAYNGSPSSDAALSAAILMHKKYGTHVTGLLAHMSRKTKFSQQTWVPDSLRKTLSDLEVSADKEVEQQFRAKTDGKIEPDKLHWITRSGDADETVAQYAQMFDLTVVGRYDAVFGSHDLDLHPDRIALKSGRPVLVIPRGWPQDRIHEHAILAWDGQRTATRALHDAMQILETKQLVTVLSIKDKKLGTPLEGIDVQTSLQRHGVNVETEMIDRQGASVGQAILDYAKERGAGLLVMGAFEHSLFREELMGGVTRHVLENTELPVFISH